MPETAQATMTRPAAAAAVTHQKRLRRSRESHGENHGASRGWYRLLSPVAVVLIWQAVSSAGLVPKDKLPPPTTIWRTALSLITHDSPAYGTLQNAMLVSLQRMAVGFRQVILPGALPQALTGLRQSLGVAWLALVVAEQVNANAGIGFIISQATQFLRNDVIMVALAVYAVLGLLTDALVRLLERKALAWRSALLPR